MPDMLVSLVRLRKIEPLLEDLKLAGITIRRPNPWEKRPLCRFIEEHFSEGWADETSVAFHHQPISCYVAFKGNEILGFGAYECTRKNYFGPTGVAEEYRGKGIGTALLLACLCGLQELGYTYAIIGGAGPADFYKKACNAVVIPFDNGNGIYGLAEEPRFMSGQGSK